MIWFRFDYSIWLELMLRCVTNITGESPDLNYFTYFTFAMVALRFIGSSCVTSSLFTSDFINSGDRGRQSLKCFF